MRTQLPIALIVAVVFACSLHASPAQAQRVFVSATGSDGNPCSFASPCRSFQHAHDVAPASGEIDVLDPAGYGALTITKSISIQGHGFSGITVGSAATGITINAGSTDDITLNGLIIDGAGTGLTGISIDSALSVQILNCVVRHFSSIGINFGPHNSPNALLALDTVVSDNATAIFIDPAATPSRATLKRLTANNNNGTGGVFVVGGQAMIANSVMFNNNAGLTVESGSIAWLANSTISGNGTGVSVMSATLDSYGNNAINGNATDISGTVTKISPE